MVRKLVPAIFGLFTLASALVAWPFAPQTATINWMETHQVIDGFGGSCADFHEEFSPQMADFFFTTSGIGLSLLRIQVVPSMQDCASFFVPNGAKCVPVESGATLLTGELAIARQAAQRGVTVWSTPWSPPASMKDNHSFINGGRLLPEYYAAWAESLVKYVRLLRSNDVPLYAMSVQNEPDIATNYGTAIFSGEELHDFVAELHFAFHAAGLDETKIMIAEASRWNFSLTDASMADPTVAKDVDILAAHGYGREKIAHPKDYGKRVWQTEDSDQSQVYDGGIGEAITWASKIHAYLTLAEVNAWHWFFLSDGPQYGDGKDNGALTDDKLNYPKRTFITGQWSKFVRPGWYRIGISLYDSPLLISAFKDPKTDAFAIVAVNPTRKAVTQTFAFNGFLASSITPWITSKNHSLAPQPSIATSGNTFSYTIPGLSVTTFSAIGRDRKSK